MGQLARWLLMLATVFMLSGCQGEEPQKEKTAENAAPPMVLPAEPEFVSMVAEDAHALLVRQPQTVVIDVRTPHEIAQGRIPGSMAVSLEAILSGNGNLPKDRPLLLVCAVGGRSYAAGLYLARDNYPLVYNLRGGMVAWARAGLPLVRGDL